MIKKLYALLIGIDEYHPKNNHIPNLEGCVNDVNALAKLFQDKYYYLDPDIKILTNEDATRDNIIQSFRSHLTDQVDEESTLLFFFSGHGSRQVASKFFQENHRATNNLQSEPASWLGTFETSTRPARRIFQSGNTEGTLVCYDSRVRKGDNWEGEDLADKELAILIEEASRKDAHIVIILDSCHSGHELPETYELSEFTNKEIEEFDTDAAYHRSYLDNYFEKMYKETGKITMPNGKYFFLSSCEVEQYSLEKVFENQRRGAFTYILEKIIRKTPVISYFDLFLHIRSEFLSNMDFPKHISQKPFFESFNGFDVDVSFLAAKEPELLTTDGE